MIEFDWETPLEVDKDINKNRKDLYHLFVKEKNMNNWYSIATYNCKTKLLRIKDANNIMQKISSIVLNQFISISEKRYEKD